MKSAKLGPQNSFNFSYPKYNLKLSLRASESGYDGYGERRSPKKIKPQKRCNPSLKWFQFNLSVLCPGHVSISVKSRGYICLFEATNLVELLFCLNKVIRIRIAFRGHPSFRKDLINL